MSERLEEIRARVEAATPGPWYPQPGYVMRSESGVHPEVCLMCGPEHTGVGSSDAVSDGAFIAHAREDIPYLLDRLERAEARVEELETRGGSYCRWCGSLADWCEANIENTHGACCKKCTHRLWRPETPFASLETGEPHG